MVVDESKAAEMDRFAFLVHELSGSAQAGSRHIVNELKDGTLLREVLG